MIGLCFSRLLMFALVLVKIGSFILWSVSSLHAFFLLLKFSVLFTR